MVMCYYLHIQYSQHFMLSTTNNPTLGVEYLTNCHHNGMMQFIPLAKFEICINELTVATS